MKNLWLIGAVVFALASCGGPSVCDCVQWEKDYRKEKSDADGDDEKKGFHSLGFLFRNLHWKRNFTHRHF